MQMLCGPKQWRAAPFTLLALFLAPVPLTALAAPDENRAAAPAAEEIVVTARKREESVQEVPLSVVALSGEQLEQRSLENLEDLGQHTPNFTFGETLNGGSVAGVAFVRGVGQRDAHPAYDPAVGLYVDGVYMGRMYANNLDMLDVERVEVLLGPQGTLFGKNTSGGAVNIISSRPDASSDGLSGRAQLTGGSRNRFDVLASINMPLVSDKLALRLAASRLQQDGYAKRADGQDMGNTDRSFARAQLSFTPSESFTALLSGDWMKFDERNAAFKLVATNPSVPPLAALNAFTPQKYDDRWISSRDYFSNGGGPNSAHGDIWGASLTLIKDVPWATLKSITAYRQMDVHSDLDPDGSPVVVINKYEIAEQHQFSQELQAAGSSMKGRLDWVMGAYYFSERADDSDRFDLLTALFGPTRGFSRTIPVENKSIAAYTQGSYALTDKTRLTLGLRYTSDEKTVGTTQFGFNGVPQYGPLEGNHKSNMWSPRLGLDHRWTDAVMTYVSVAHGAKNGGFNGRAGRASDFTEFDDEVLWTYEAGLRSTLLDGRLRFNATAFYSRYEDLQLQISGSTVVNGGPAPFSLITNIPEATIRGGELGLRFSPVKGLAFTAGLGITDGKYTQLPTDSQFVASRIIDKDSEFSNSPELSYTVGAEYSTPVSDSLLLTANVDYTHKSRMYLTPENTVNSLQPAYGLLNARLTFTHERSGISVAVFGMNLTDEVYMLAAFDDANNPNPGLGFATVTQAAPRQWGVSAQVKF